MTLNERERFILHAVTAMTISSLKPDDTIDIRSVMKLILKDRCRHLKEEDVTEILNDVLDEIFKGQLVYEEMIASFRGEDLEKFR